MNWYRHSIDGVHVTQFINESFLIRSFFLRKSHDFTTLDCIYKVVENMSIITGEVSV